MPWWKENHGIKITASISAMKFINVMANAYLLKIKINDFGKKPIYEQFKNH